MNVPVMKKLLPFLGILCFACSSSGPDPARKTEIPVTPAEQYLWAQAQAHFEPITGMADNPANPVTPEKVALGKMLYYDTRLSRNGNNSCNSCHNLAAFGADKEAFSLGDAGKPGGRNSPSVYNAALATFQFWDGRARDVEEQAGMPILNPAEMAIPSRAFLEERLRNTPGYPALFAAAFPKDPEPLRYENLQKAIGAFERTLVTPGRFDDFIGKNPSYLTLEEKQGLQLFIETGCTNCHSGAAVGGTQFRKFGLFGDYTTETKSTRHDIGRQEITGQASDRDVFKVPSLRNVAETAPYFHDGSVGSLSEAIRIMARLQLNKDLDAGQVRKIEAFLRSLTGTIPASALPEGTPQ